MVNYSHNTCVPKTYYFRTSSTINSDQSEIEKELEKNMKKLYSHICALRNCAFTSHLT